MLNNDFIIKYDLAKKYYEKNGNLRIPRDFRTKDGVTYDSEGISLAFWISTQKRKYNFNKLSEEKIELLEQIGIKWDFHKYIWNERYKLAKKYYEKYGNLSIPENFRTNDGINFSENGFRLGNWLAGQKQIYKNNNSNRLSNKEIKKLESIGIKWDIRTSNWEDHYDLAKKYYKKYGDLRIPYTFKTNDGINYSEDGFKLGSWIAEQKNAYKGTGTNKIDSEKIKKLEDIGMIWDVLDYLWDKYYELAKDYYLKNGDLLIPSEYEIDDIKLGRWITTIKRMYRDNKISNERIESLNKIGMVWDHSLNYRWNINYNLAKEYYLKNKNLSIPVNYITDKGVKLGEWIVTQRRVYKGLKTGILTEEQINLLNEIEMVWDIKKDKRIDRIRDNKWNNKYELAKNYYLEKGNLNVPLSYKVNNCLLGRWIDTQKDVYKGITNYTMKDEQIKLLNDIGMKWFKESEDKKLKSQIIKERSKRRKQIEILNRFKTYLLNYDSNSLPNKEEINEGFVKYLTK